ncbi:LytTr DNA-binding domain-containing protein [Ekhidna lutea]|uniref:LytTr DNA-binding domain-containing protein n=1 Tax=Ekhidna lutea TaxID=447679 RepID=A0A239K7F2_EKHLU|nr:LytTR family DNA-binding domain-containing protein [Ekhidna lutea]SNT13612.1 LytTr DNA-binding domain-containing protein [Ekhidna lutea]
MVIFDDMITKHQLFFWSGICGFLTLLFSTSLNGLLVSFYFVTFLIPVILGTSIFFNRYLVPKYLMRGKRMQFALYLIYLAVVSVYLELMVMILAFIILADYQFSNLGSIAGDIYILTMVLYIIVSIEGMVIAFRRLKERDDLIANLKVKLEKEQMQEIVIRSNRKNVPVKLNDILFIESMADYIKVHTISETILSKEKISAISERLPDGFVRVHRSFIVNRDQVGAYDKETVTVGQHEIPIGRKYKSQAVNSLESLNHSSF